MYKRFRQSRPLNDKPGRSDWPEPNAIRRLFATHLDTGSRSHAPGKGQDAFPRHEFGLPIVFWFKDSEPKSGKYKYHQYDPDQTELLPNETDSNRHASPLIFRSVRYKDDYNCIALLLPQPWRLPSSERLRLKLTAGSESKTVNGKVEQPITLSSHGITINAGESVLSCFFEEHTRPWL